MNGQKEQRKFYRQVCQSEEAVILRISKIDFKVIDISERGLRFVNNGKLKLTGWISGSLLIGDKKPIDIDGIIVRKKDDEIGIHLISPIRIG